MHVQWLAGVTLLCLEFLVFMNSSIFYLVLSSFLPFLGKEVAVLEDPKFGSCTWSWSGQDMLTCFGSKELNRLQSGSFTNTDYVSEPLKCLWNDASCVKTLKKASQNLKGIRAVTCGSELYIPSVLTAWKNLSVCFTSLCATAIQWTVVSGVCQPPLPSPQRKLLK